MKKTLTTGDWTEQKVRDLLPDIRIKVGDEYRMGWIKGRMENFAHVVDPVTMKHAEYSFRILAGILNTDNVACIL